MNNREIIQIIQKPKEKEYQKQNNKAQTITVELETSFEKALSEATGNKYYYDQKTKTHREK